MRYRKGIFIVVFSGKKPKYLVLHRILHWSGWEFPKGGVENNESYKKAIIRELKEETGLKALKIFDLNKAGKFNYGTKFRDRPEIKGQEWKLFAAEVKKAKPRLGKIEHIEYKWLEFKQAYKILTWKDQKKCLEFVDNFLKKV